MLWAPHRPSARKALSLASCSAVRVCWERALDLTPPIGLQFFTSSCRASHAGHCCRSRIFIWCVDDVLFCDEAGRGGRRRGG